MHFLHPPFLLCVLNKLPGGFFFRLAVDSEDDIRFTYHKGEYKRRKDDMKRRRTRTYFISATLVRSYDHRSSSWTQGYTFIYLAQMASSLPVDYQVVVTNLPLSSAK